MDGAGRTAGGQYATGYGSQTEAVKRSGRSLNSAARSSASETSMVQTGKDLAAGLASGISSMVDWVGEKARTLAHTAKWNVESAMQIMSPSRVMRKDGKFFGEGFGLGIQDMFGYVGKTARNLALNAAESASAYKDKFQEIMVADMDMNPVITPVLDMSNMDMDMLEKYDAASIKLSGVGLSQREMDHLNGNTNTNNSETVNNYTIQITANGELPTSVINKMADKFETAIKNKNDRAQFNRGEFVTY